MALVINHELLTRFSNEGKLKVLFYYAKISEKLAGRGYCKYSDLQNILNVSAPTVGRFVKAAQLEGLLVAKNNHIYLIGKYRVSRRRGVTSKTNIKFFDFSAFKAFRNHFLVQSGLIYQNRFKFNHKRLMKNLECPLKVEGIQYPISANKAKVGCSLSYISKKTGYSKSIISTSLVGETIQGWEYIKQVTKPELAILKKYSYFKDNPRVRYKGFSLFYRTSNIVTAQSSICRR